MNEKLFNFEICTAPALQASSLLMEAGYTQLSSVSYHTFGFTYLGVTTSEEFKATEWKDGAHVETGETFKKIIHSLFVLFPGNEPRNKLNIGANAKIFTTTQTLEMLLLVYLLILDFHTDFFQHSLLWRSPCWCYPAECYLSSFYRKWRWCK